MDCGDGLGGRCTASAIGSTVVETLVLKINTRTTSFYLAGTLQAEKQPTLTNRS